MDGASLLQAISLDIDGNIRTRDQHTIAPNVALSSVAKQPGIHTLRTRAVPGFGDTQMDGNVPKLASEDQFLGYVFYYLQSRGGL